jgi:hypothetical protein
MRHFHPLVAQRKQKKGGQGRKIGGSQAEGKDGAKLRNNLAKDRISTAESSVLPAGTCSLLW